MVQSGLVTVDCLSAQVGKIGKEPINAESIDENAMGFLEGTGPSGLHFFADRVWMNFQPKLP